MASLIIKKDFLFKFIVVLFFLLPSSSIVGGPSIWFLIIFFFACITLVIGYENSVSQDIVYFKIFFLFSLFFITISIFRSYQYAIFDDLFELLRVASLLVFLLCGYFLSSRRTSNFLLKFFLFYLIFQFVVVVLQKIEPLKSLMSIIWDMDKAWALRGTGTLGNPNVLALMSILSMLFIRFFSNRKKIIVLAFIICSLNVLLSGSRTGLVGYFLVTMFILFISGKISIASIVKKIVVISIFSITAVLLLISLSGELRYMGELLNAFSGDGMDLTKVGTFNHRVEAWERQFRLFENSGDISILIGMGPAKGVGFRVMDNDYMAQYLKYGLIGVLSNILLLIMIFVSTWRSNKIHSNATKFIAAILLTYLIFALTAATFLSLFNMLPLMLLTGFLIKLGFKGSYIIEKSDNNLSCSSTD